MPRIWKPSVTVAAIVERDGLFLLIEEETSEGIKLNQPAGHLDPFESLEQAVIRETLEEAAYDFHPTALVGMYMSRYRSLRTGEDVTYLRFTFCGTAGTQHDRPLVLQCVDEYLAGRRAPLALLHTHASVFNSA